MEEYLNEVFRFYDGQPDIHTIYTQIFKRLYQINDISKINTLTVSKKFLEISNKFITNISKNKKYQHNFDYIKSYNVLNLYIWDSDIFNSFTNFNRIKYNSPQARGILSELLVKYRYIIEEENRQLLPKKKFINLMEKTRNDIKNEINKFIIDYENNVKDCVQKLKILTEIAPKLDRPIITFRGLHYRPDIPESKKYIQYIQSLKIGDSFGMDGFTSVSPTPIYSLEVFTSDNCCLLCITIPKGSPVLYAVKAAEIILWKPVLKITNKRLLSIDIDLPNHQDDYTLQIIDVIVSNE